MDFQNKLDNDVKELISKYENGKLELIDFAIEVLNYAALENPDIYKRVNEILKNSTKKTLGKPKTISPEQVVKIHELKKNGSTQEKIAWITGVSLSSVRRELKNSPPQNAEKNLCAKCGTELQSIPRPDKSGTFIGCPNYSNH